jgi:hypothetical protein
MEREGIAVLDRPTYEASKEHVEFETLIPQLVKVKVNQWISSTVA